MSANENGGAGPLLLRRWQCTLASRHAEPAIYAADREILRTFPDIEAESGNLGRSLEGYAPGSVIAIQIGNHPSWPALLLACVRRGLIPLPLGGHLGSGERASALETCGAACVVEAGEGNDTVGFSTLAPSSPSPASTEFLKLTSGTTAEPRAIRFQMRHLIADCDNICDTMGLTASDLNFGVIPFSHSYGFSNLITPLLCRGIPFVVSEDRLPRAILSGLARTGASVLPGTPVFYQAFAAMENIPPLPSLRLCVSAGGPLSATTARNFTERFQRKVHSFYGASECGGIAYDGSESTEYEDNFAGAPMRNVEVTPLEATGPSLIRVASAAVGDGYFPVHDPSTLGNGHFFPTDLVEISRKGMALAGRVCDIINVAGRKLNPLEVEARLAGFPGVRQAVVFGVASAFRNEEPVACVAGDRTLAVPELLRFCRAALGAWQVPKDIWLVEEIPSNERGKFSRRELARAYLAREK